MHKKHVYVLLGNKPNVLKMHQIYIFFFYHKPNIFHIFNPTPPNHTVLQQNPTTHTKKNNKTTLLH